MPTGTLRRIVPALGALAVMLGSLALVGWQADAPVLASLRPHWPTMKANTAVGVIALGTALILRTGTETRPRRAIGMLGAAIATALGLLTLYEIASSTNLGVDELLVGDSPRSPHTSAPARMSPNTAFGLVLLGLASMLLGARKSHVAASQLLTAPVMIVALMGVLRYGYGGPAEGAEHFTVMSLPSALSFLSLSGGLFVSRPEAGVAKLLISPHLGGRLFRRLLPVVVLVPATMSLLRAHAQIAGLFDDAFGSALLTTLVVLVLSGAVLWNAGVLDRIDAERHRASSALDAQHAALNAEIAERKRNEEDLAALKGELERRVLERTAELEAVNVELEAFSYSVSHDLRAPLRWLDGFTRALSEHSAGQLDAEGRGYLQHIVEAGRTMRETVDSLLELSRITRAQLLREPVDLSALAREITSGLAAAEAQRHVELVAPEALVAMSDERLVRLMLSNLLQNAWKFTRPRACARIELGASEEDGDPVYYVRDNGVGFDMASAGRLFRPFERLHSASEFEGSGVGLAIVRRVAQRHGGRVWARASVDEGATFYFTFGERA